MKISLTVDQAAAMLWRAKQFDARWPELKMRDWFESHLYVADLKKPELYFEDKDA